MQKYEPVDFTELVYTCGVVFESMDASREQVEHFLRTGDLDGLRRPERETLLDFGSATEHLIREAPSNLDGAYVINTNRRFGRTGSIRAGELRSGVTTSDLENLVDRSFPRDDPLDTAVALASRLIGARPFEGANRRTAWFVAGAALLPLGFTMPVPTVPGFTEALERGIQNGDTSSAEATMRSGIVRLYMPVVRRQRPKGYVAPDRPRRPSHETDDLLRYMGGDPASRPMYRAAQIANSLMDRAFDQFVRVSGTQLIAAVRLVEAEYLRRTGGRPLIEGTDSLTKYSRRRVIDEWIVDTDGSCLLGPEGRDADFRAALDLVWLVIRR